MWLLRQRWGSCLASLLGTRLVSGISICATAVSRLYQGQVVVVEAQSEDGQWPRLTLPVKDVTSWLSRVSFLSCVACGFRDLRNNVFHAFYRAWAILHDCLLFLKDVCEAEIMKEFSGDERGNFRGWAVMVGRNAYMALCMFKPQWDILSLGFLAISNNRSQELSFIWMDHITI